MEDDGFAKVSNRPAKNRKRKRISDISVINNISEYQKQIRGSEFFSQFCELFKTALKNVEISEKLGHDEQVPENISIQDIICYGLGSFSTLFNKSRHQMALLLLISEITQCTNVFLYDPVFTKSDSKVLNQLNCMVIKNNEEGKRKIKGRTVFYLPHCHGRLHNSILWANWTPENLSKIVFIGNSLVEFVRYPCKTIISSLKRKYSYIFKVLPAVIEHDIPNTFQPESIFNAFTLITFDSAVLQTFTKDIWQNAEEPFYDCCDEYTVKCTLKCCNWINCTLKLKQ